MSETKIGYCEIELYLPGVSSLKEKRGIIKSLLTTMHNQFNVANAEVGKQDVWQSATIALSTVSNSSAHIHKTMQNVIKWIESRYPDAIITEQSIEIL